MKSFKLRPGSTTTSRDGRLSVCVRCVAPKRRKAIASDTRFRPQGKGSLRSASGMKALFVPVTYRAWHLLWGAFCEKGMEEGVPTPWARLRSFNGCQWAQNKEQVLNMPLWPTLHESEELVVTMICEPGCQLCMSPRTGQLAALFGLCLIVGVP